MIRYCCQRLLTAIPVLLGISLLAFILGVLSPGDPAEFVLNQDGLYAPTEEQIAAMRTELGLDKPLWLRYGLWLLGVLQGDLGTSYITGRDIAAEILQRLPVTLELAVLALVMAGVGGIFLGSVCAVYRGSFFDNFVKSLTNIMLSIPGFWLALVLILVFSEQLRWLPTSGTGSLKYFLLPAFVLAFATLATVCRFMRGALLTEFGRQYFLVAKARGISKVNLLTRYALPNAIIPVIALLGNYFASVLGGSVIAESIFAIPGISSMALEAIRYRDYPVLQAYVLVSGCTLILVMVAVDLLIAYLNPKVKLGERS
ncbi:ABC transporter permease [Phascolarctobacterium sp.]